MEARTAAVWIAAAGAAALVSIPLAAIAGPPYLSLSGLSPWLVVFAVGLFGFLFAIPFALHAAAGGQLEADARWEQALLRWGLVALAIGALGVVLGLPSGFASDSLAGSLAIVIVAEALLVLGTLLAWLLSS